MAGAGYKLFNTGDVLTAAQVNTYLQEQTVMVFATSAARTSALSGVLAEGMVSYLQDTNAVEVYNGSAWVGVSGAGDVTEVQAGTGISVASGTGPIPVVTNTMATAIDAEGDLIIGDAADAFQRLAIGSNTHVLTVDTSVDGKIKWAAPSSSGMTLIKRSTFSNVANTGTTFDSVFTTSYENYFIFFNVYAANNGAEFYFQLRGSATTRSTSYYGLSNAYNSAGTNDQITQSNLSQFTLHRLSNNTTPAITTLKISNVGQGTNEEARFVGDFMGTANVRGGQAFGIHDSSSTNDGFILSTSSGNLYGEASVYGLAK